MKLQIKLGHMRNSLASTAAGNLRQIADLLEKCAKQAGHAPDSIGINLGELMVVLQAFLEDRAHTASLDMCGCDDCVIEYDVLYTRTLLKLVQ